MVHLKIKEEVECSICEKLLSSKQSLNIHMKAAHDLGEAKNLKCGVCPFETLHRSSLRGHIDMVHEKIKNNICGECGSSFYSPRDLAKHEKSIHLKIKDLICSICSEGFSLMSTLKSHMKNVHLKINDNNIV